MASMSQMIKRRGFKQIDSHWLRLVIFMLACFCSANGLANDAMPKDITSQEHESKRFEALSLKLEQHLQEWEELRPAIKRLVSNEADLEFLITELSKMSKLKANPTPEQLNNEHDIVWINKESIKGPYKSSERSALPESKPVKPNKNKSNKIKYIEKVEQPNKVNQYLAVTNVKQFSNYKKTAVEQGELFAIHLASFVRVKNVQLGWLIYQAKYSALLKGKLPLSMDIVKDGTRYHRLLAGMFKSKKQAKDICDELKEFNQYCRVDKYKEAGI